MTTFKTAEQFPPASPQAAREVRRNSPLRQARTCYDHLAGVAGVGLMEELLQRGWLEEAGHHSSRVLYRLTAQGEQSLASRGVDLVKAGGSRRMYAYACLDWTERRFHLGGALAAGILQALGNAGIIQREIGNRIVTVSQPLACWLDWVSQKGR